MPQPNDPDDPAVEEAMVPRAWAASPVTSGALDGECTCPLDCPHDHEHE